MILSASKLQVVMPGASKKNIDIYAPIFNELLPKWGINTPLRVAAFLAQVAHESGQLKYTREIWGPNKWQLTYDTNKGLGNKFKGDGKKFLGRGLIQITGRYAYQKFGNDFFFDGNYFLNNPELVEQPYYAVLSAIWFWNTTNLNKAADAGDFIRVTKRVNPAMLGYKGRYEHYKKALAAFITIQPMYN